MQIINRENLFNYILTTFLCRLLWLKPAGCIECNKFEFLAENAFKMK